MVIYPKTSESLEGMQTLKKYIQKYRGVEIQVLNWESDEKIYNVINELKNEIPEILEVTIHPPLIDEYDFEVLTYQNIKREEERINKMIEISQDFNIKVNLLYHVTWNFSCWKSSGTIENLKYLLKLLDNTNVNIVIENIYSVVERRNCTVLSIAKELDNPHLGVCLDICHLHCEANIYKIPFDEFLNNYLNKEDCKKYIYQIHFSGTLNNDGYTDLKTHGRKHDSIQSFEKDYKILTDYEFDDKIIVTEIGEDNYNLRIDQEEEIKMLENINK